MEDTRITQGRHAPEKQARARQMRREMTTAERLLWLRLKGNKLAGLHFRRQQVIDGFIADFYCHEAKLVVEVDGPIHATQIGYDAERDQILTARGLKLLRLSNSLIERRLETDLAQIQAAALPMHSPPIPLPLGRGAEEQGGVGPFLRSRLSCPNVFCRL